MVKRTAQIFQRRIYDIASAIADPGPIAVQLFAERLIPEAVLNRATLNTIVAHERTSPLLDALMKALKTDYNEPAMFKKLCVVLMNFSETEAQGRGMYKEYYGRSPSPSPPPSPPPAHLPPPQRTVSFQIEGDDQCDSGPDPVPPPSESRHREVSQRVSPDPVPQQPSEPIGDITIPTPFGPMIVPIAVFGRFSSSHPWLTRIGLIVTLGFAVYVGYKVVKNKLP